MSESWEAQLNMDWDDPDQWLSQPLGDVESFYSVCGYNALMGFHELCPECRKAKNDHGCGRYFAVGQVRGSLE